MTRFVVIMLAGAFISRGGEIADYYYNHVRGSTNAAEMLFSSQKKSRGHQEVESTSHGITEIAIERGGSVWGGPRYTFIAYSIGTFRYDGEKDVERLGKHSGTVPVWGFHELAQFIRDSGYMAFENNYDRAVTDSPTTYTSVVSNGTRKVIRNYASAGPTTLWAIEKLIDDLMKTAKWGITLPVPSEPVLPETTRYDNDPALRVIYLSTFHKGYVDAWQRNENIPVFSPTSSEDKARVFGYADGMVAGRAALSSWTATNKSGNLPTNAPPVQK